MLQKYFSDVTFMDISHNGEISAIGLFIVKCVATARELLLLHFWNIRSNDGCPMQQKHVAIYNYYNKVLSIDWLYVYCYILYRHNKDGTH